jgi:hypothetical protein
MVLKEAIGNNLWSAQCIQAYQNSILVDATANRAQLSPEEIPYHSSALVQSNGLTPSLHEAGGGNIYVPIHLIVLNNADRHGWLVSCARWQVVMRDAEFGIWSNSKNEEEWSGLHI